MGVSTGSRRHHVVVIGGGFGGLQAVRKLRGAPVEITLIDRRNFHLFQPLLYQVATGSLSAEEIASPLRSVFRRNKNVRVVLGEVTGFDLAARHVKLDHLPSGGGSREIRYDSLIVAAGSKYTYFGHDEWRPFAPDVKSVESALEVRRRILTAFEAADTETDPERRAAWLTFVIVGAGPTGVELAGQIGEIARRAVRNDFRDVDTGRARILLVETADRVLPPFPPRLSEGAGRALERLGVTLLTSHTVVELDATSLTLRDGDGVSERVAARTVIWAAGVIASELATCLDAETGAGLDRAGRISVGPDLTLPGHPEVIVLGEMALLHGADGTAIPLPGVAPVAMQEGRYAARAIRDRLQGRTTKPFHYRDKGNLATIGRAKAVADIKGLQLSGVLAWLTWLFVHLFYLIGLQNRLIVFTRWCWSFVTHGRGARLITMQAITPPGVPPPPDEHPLAGQVALEDASEPAQGRRAQHE
jgi:NADH:ubiquinone reductase (H+-translocating)